MGNGLDYDLYFKWGLIMSKAGLATLSVKESEYQGAPSWHYNLLFRSAGVIEKVFRMRDTMDCHYSKEPRLLFSSKRTNEGDYYLVDNLQFEYQGSGRIDIHSHRHTLKETKIDTMLMAKGRVFDMLGATMYLPFAGLADDELWCGVPFHDRYRPGARERSFPLYGTTDRRA